jgi:hypothetical protein
METAPEGLSLGRLRATACSRLPGNHSAGQGSRKPRRRIHVSGPLRRLARGHVSMVSRWRKPGNCIFRGIPRCGAGAPATAAAGNGLRHSGTARTGTYDVDAAFMLMERNAACLIGPQQDVLKPDIQCVRTHWNRDFMAFQLGPGWCGRPRRVVGGVGVVGGADGTGGDGNSGLTEGRREKTE